MALPYLKWTDSAGTEIRLNIDRDTTLIGRLSDSDVVLTNPYVSRQHARLEKRQDGYYLVDLNSTHGTFVNGEKISERLLSGGDRVQLGRNQIELLFLVGDGQEAGARVTPETTLDFEKSVMQLTSVIGRPTSESSHLETISSILDFQYNWEKSFSPEATFRQILDSALKLSGAERGFVLLREGEEFEYIVGLSGGGELLSEAEFPASRTAVQKVAGTGQPVMMTENLDQQFSQQASIVAMDLRALACMPLKWISSKGDEAQVNGILYLDSKKTMHALTGLDQKILYRLAAEAANVFEKLELIKSLEERKQLDKELALANETQRALLPQKLPELASYSVTAFSKPTRHVGGDFFDFFHFGENLSGILADVSGKGISAALLSSLLQGALQMQWRAGKRLDAIANELNLYLCERSTSSRFVTLFLFSVDSEGKGEYISAGHNPSYLYRASSGKIVILPSNDIVLGAFDFAAYHAIPVTLSSGDILVVYSDGVTEAMNPGDDMFGEERLVKLITEWAQAGCQALQEKILAELEEFTLGRAQTDDITVMLLQKS